VTAESGDTLPTDWDLGARRVQGARAFRDGARIATLLAARGHGAAALGRLDAAFGVDGVTAKMSAFAIQDPSILSLRSRLLEEIDRIAEAEVLVVDPRAVTMSFGPWWAIRGRLARAAGHEAEARESFEQALAVDPLDEEVACDPGYPEAEVSGAAATATERTRLCEIARGAGGSDFDAD
jgi:hypothetical protein